MPMLPGFEVTYGSQKLLCSAGLYDRNQMAVDGRYGAHLLRYFYEISHQKLFPDEESGKMHLETECKYKYLWQPEKLPCRP